MMKKLYWLFRILAYTACLSGILYYLVQSARDPQQAQYGLFIVYAGFLCFFLSYALRAWMRFAPKKSTRVPAPPPDA